MPRPQQPSSRNVVSEESLERARARVRCCVATGCIITVVLFGVMVHLMQTVNPAPLKPEKPTKEESLKSSDGTDSQQDMDQDSQHSSNQDKQLGANQDTQPGANQDTQPGANQDTQPGANQDTQLGTNQDTQLGTNLDTQLGTSQDSQPDTIQEIQQNAEAQDLTRKLHGDTRIKKLVNKTSHDSLRKTFKIVVPPVWPKTLELVNLLNVTNVTPQDRMVNKTVVEAKNEVKSSGSEPNRTTPSTNDTLSLMSKRSVSDDKKLQDDLNSVILKIIDASGKFNIEIKIASNNATAEIKNEIKENKIRSDNSKYSMSLKRNNNDDLIIKLAKNMIISVMPNESVAVDDYDDHNVIEKTEIKNNMIPENTTDLNNITKCDNNCNKSTLMPNYKDVFKPIVIFYNQTKVIYHSDPKAKYNGKRDLLDKTNNTSDESNMNFNSLKTDNSMDYNLTMQTENTTIENIVTTSHKNTTIEIEKDTISTKNLDYKHETSTTEKETSNLNANGNSIQNDTGNLIEMEELLQSQQQLTFKNMGFV